MMNSLSIAGARVRRYCTRQTLFVAFAICAVWFLGSQFRRETRYWSPLREKPDMRPQPRRMPTHQLLPPLLPPVACHGPRGHLLNQSKDDELLSRELDGRTK